MTTKFRQYLPWTHKIKIYPISKFYTPANSALYVYYKINFYKQIFFIKTVALTDALATSCSHDVRKLICWEKFKKGWK